MFWNKQGRFGKQLDKNKQALAEGDYSKAPLVFCVFSEKHNLSKLMASKALCAALDTLEFDEIVQINKQMRQTASMEWGIDWSKFNIFSFLTGTMNARERRAVIVFASLNPNGFIREQAIRLMADCPGTLPYIILRLNDWVFQVRQSAANAFNKRMKAPSNGEILAALPYAEKLKWALHNKDYPQIFFSELTSPKHRADLIEGLKSPNVRTRKICVQALLDSEHPDIDLAFQRLKREPDPFLRNAIFKKLQLLQIDLAEHSKVFLRDKYFANRILALQCLRNTKKNDILQYAKPMLLDSNSVGRGLAREIVREHAEDFDFSKFYLEHIESRAVPAIWGLGETGKKDDAKTIEKYLNDTRVAVARAAIIALMRLDRESIESEIVEMLGDSRKSIVKTSHQMIVKYGVADYDRIHEIFRSAPYEYSKVKCAAILFSASKWQSLIYMLESLSSETAIIQNLAVQSISEWLLKFNKSFVLATEQQLETITQLIASNGERLPVSIKRELLFVANLIEGQNSRPRETSGKK